MFGSTGKQSGLLRTCSCSHRHRSIKTWRVAGVYSHAEYLLAMYVSFETSWPDGITFTKWPYKNTCHMQYTYLIWHIFIFVDMANNVWTKCLLHVCYGMMFFTVCSISLLCFTRYTLHHRKGPNLHCYKSDQVIPPRTDLKLGLSLLCTAGVRWRWASGSSR